MVDLTITIPDEMESRLLDALCDMNGYTAELGPRRAFARQMIIRLLREQVRFYERQKAREQAESGVTDLEIT